MTPRSNSNTTYHSRSISLPSGSHPLLTEIEDQLSRLQSFESISTSSQSLTHQVTNLKYLFDCVDELLILQSNQHALSKDPHAVNDVLDGSLRLLDVCGVSKDAVAQIKDCIQTVQSSLRRRGSGELTIMMSQVSEYANCRKQVKKTARRSLKEIQTTVITNHHDQQQNRGALGLLRESEVAAMEIFESLLVFISGIKKKNSRWSVASKLLLLRGHRPLSVKNGGRVETSTGNAFEDVDVDVGSLLDKKGGIDVVKAEYLRNKMEHLESETQELDQVLECLFRRLVKTRATLLNVLSD